MNSQWRDLADQKLSQLKLTKRELEDEQSSLFTLRKELKAALEAQKHIQTVAAEVQHKVHQRIAGIVTRCLQTIFDESYQFKIVFNQKRGKTEAEFVVIKNGREMDPTTASGGSLVDVIALGLRLAAVILTRPAPRKLLVLDEPFRFLAEENRPKVTLLIEELARELDFQFILVTHEPELQAGKVIEIV